MSKISKRRAWRNFTIYRLSTKNVASLEFSPKYFPWWYLLIFVLYRKRIKLSLVIVLRGCSIKWNLINIQGVRKVILIDFFKVTHSNNCYENRAPCYHAWYMTIFLNRYATMWLMFHLLWTWKTLEHATQFLTWDNWDMLNMSKIKFVSKFKLQHFLENSFSIFKVNAFRNCYRVKFD